MKPQKVDDKIIEVVAHKGSIHLIQIKAGTRRPRGSTSPSLYPITELLTFATIRCF